MDRQMHSCARSKSALPKQLAVHRQVTPLLSINVVRPRGRDTNNQVSCKKCTGGLGDRGWMVREKERERSRDRGMERARRERERLERWGHGLSLRATGTACGGRRRMAF